MKKLFVVCMLIGLTACAPQKGDQGDPGNVVPPATVLPSQADVNSLISDENSYREGLGQTALTNGLTCSVQLVGSGQWLSSSSPGYNVSQGIVTALSGSTSYTYLYQSNFNVGDTNGSNVNPLIPPAIQPLFLNANYKISCSGQVVVTSTNYYAFVLDSDDGSILTVDGSQVINNDGNHSMTVKSGTKYLRRGVHTFSLLYAQSGVGNFGLILTANGSLIDPMYYFH